MYTFESKFFSKEFEKAAVEALEGVRAFLTPEDFLSATNEDPHQAQDVMRIGRRWKSNDECFQSMVMAISNHLRDARGPGMMTAEEAEMMERKIFRGDSSVPTLEELAYEGMIQAIGCDHWYMFEKEWE